MILIKKKKLYKKNEYELKFKKRKNVKIKPFSTRTIHIQIKKILQFSFFETYQPTKFYLKSKNELKFNRRKNIQIFMYVQFICK